MRSHISSAIAILFAGVGVAAEPTETITVTGSATVFVKPDSARIHYVVRVTDTSIEAVNDTATKRVASIGESIKGLKISNLTTSSGTVAYGRTTASRGGRAFGGAGGFPGGGGGPNPAAAPGPQTTYHAQVPLTATIKEMSPDKLRAAVDTFVKKVVECGATITGDSDDAESAFVRARAVSSSDAARIDWFLSNDAAARREAVRTAIRKAKADAETMANELGWEKFKIISASDAASLLGERLEASISPRRLPAGEVAVTARVMLKCSR